MPVSKISIVGDRSSNGGGSRWIAQRSRPSGAGSLLSTGSPSTFQTRPSVIVADRHRDRLAACRRPSMPRGEAVRRVHRDRADAVVAEMLLHLRDQDARLLALARRDRRSAARV